METLYTICAVAGGTFLGLQLLLLIIGFGGGGEADFDVGDPGDIGDAGDFDVDSGEGASGAETAHAFQVISTKTLTAFFTFFGLGGMLGDDVELTFVPGLAMAIGCGLIAVFIVAYLWSMLYRLQSHGNVDVRKAVGTVGRVYLRVPGEGAGHGKVTVAVQGRTVELSASTTEEEIPTGTEVKIIAFIGKETVQVVRAESV